jgi:hypothetical protein
MTPTIQPSMSSAALLGRLPRYLSNAWKPIDSRRAFFGDGSSGENGIRSNANVAFSTAVLLRDQDQPDSVDNLALRKKVTEVLNYLCDSHRTGPSTCANGGKWGLEWQSAWWAAKIGLAAMEMRDWLGAETHASVVRVVTAEADRQLQRHAPTGLFLDTKAEETAWDCESLAVALALAPGHAHTQRWRDKLIEFSFNVFSVPQDRTSTATLSGQRVADAVYTCNVHGDFSLENHGSYHFCYVASPLLSKAYCFHALRLAGIDVPDALQHHVDDMWCLVRHTFLTHRFAYIGGQDWARYTYGEYFIVPALSYLDACIADPEIRRVQAQRLAFIAAEAAANTDGSFYGRRFTAGQFDGQMGKYETDTFACIALARAWERLDDAKAYGGQRAQVSEVAPEFVHVSPEGQFCFWRTPDFFFSFAWSYLGKDIPSLVFGPVARDDLIEWHPGNGLGRVKAHGEGAVVGVRTMRRVDDRIEIQGETVTRSRSGQPMYETRLSLVFDRATRSVRVSHQVKSLKRMWLVRATGLSLRIPNDLFNGLGREVRANGSQVAFPSRRPEAGKPSVRPWWTRIPKLQRILRKLTLLDEVIRLESSTVEVDDALVIESDQPNIVLRRFDHPASTWRSLWVDEFQAPGASLRISTKPGETLLSTNVVIRLRQPGRG